jgi:hypothetical protein
MHSKMYLKMQQMHIPCFKDLYKFFFLVPLSSPFLIFGGLLGLVIYA